MALMTAFDRNGRRVLIPDHWMSDPDLSREFSTTPPESASEGCCGGMALDDDEDPETPAAAGDPHDNITNTWPADTGEAEKEN